ncbi:MAG: sulfite exporter TauE/SafE family protein [Gemmatimonadales bacterium]|nr:sulfite exporter TauE/SafE family protein [Gemmatimonadales bacterium]
MEPIYVVIGLVAGTFAGLFGVGGGVLIVPALIFLAKFPIKVALGTSLAAIAILPVGLLGVYTYYRHGNLNIKASLLIAGGIFLGAWVGSRLAQIVPAATLQRIFAVFILIMAVRLWITAGKTG